MKIKKGVTLAGIKPELMVGLFIADGVWKSLGQELVITSVTDSKHGKHSLHYTGFAGDLRTRYFDESEVPAVASALRDALGNSPDFDIVVEKTHIHIEWQPEYHA